MINTFEITKNSIKIYTDDQLVVEHPFKEELDQEATKYNEALIDVIRAYVRRANRENKAYKILYPN